MKKYQIVVITILTTLAIIALAIGIYYVYFFNKTNVLDLGFNLNNNSNTSSISDTSSTSTSSSSTIDLSKIDFSGIDKIGRYIETDNYYRDYSYEYPTGTIKVSWSKGVTKLSASDEKAAWDKVDPDGSLRKLYLDTLKQQFECEDCEIYLFKAGSITSPASLKGKLLYNLVFSGISIGMGGPYQYDYYAFLDETRNNFVVFDRGYYSFNNNLCKIINYAAENCSEQQDIIGGVIRYNFTELDPPDIIKIPNQESFLKRNGSVRHPFNFVSSTATSIGILYMTPSALESNKEFTDSKYGAVYYDGSCYMLVTPDGNQYFYDLIPYFFNSDVSDLSEADKQMYPLGYKVNATWNKDNKGLYILGGEITLSGCTSGIQNCSNVVDKSSWFSTNKLKVIGKTFSGDELYELSDKEVNQYYKDVFENSGYLIRSTEFNYEYNNTTTEYLNKLKSFSAKKFSEFLSDYPVFFWKDYQGRYRVYHKSSYIKMAECGKPVIYLYPQFTTDVKVKVEPNGGFTKTDPFYLNDGWFVKANPNSELYNYNDGQTYPYLFWEGKAYNYQTPDYGFVLSKSEVEIKMKAILAKLGLNQKETTDFLEFWQPRLEVKPYVFVTFISQAEFDKLAPLTVSPKPDSVIRVFMDYKPLNEKITVREPIIRTPSRNGFTVVEWGGRLIY